MSIDTTNAYANLSIAELKALRRLHKADAAKVAAIDAAIAAKTPYNAGRLTNLELSSIALLLENLVHTGAVTGVQAQHTNDALKSLERFKIQAPAAPVVTPPAPVGASV